MRFSLPPVSRYLSVSTFLIALALPALVRAQDAPSPLPSGALCVTRTNGQLRLIDVNEACRTSEVRLSFEQLIGPQGPAGPAGATGATGATGVAGATGATGAVGATGAAGPQGATGAQGAIGAQGPAGANGTSATVRAAELSECATGGVVVSDGTNSIPVCNGAAGQTGAAGVIGPAGPVGATGPAGTAGSVLALNENTAVVPVTNLEVEIAGMASFHPTATSRIGFDVGTSRVNTPGGPQLHVHQPTVPVITFRLPANAPMAGLRDWWSDMVQGNLVRKNVTITLQAPNGAGDALEIRVGDAYLASFSDGSLSPASMAIAPQSIQVTKAASFSLPIYSLLELPILASHSLTVNGESRGGGLAAVSGGQTFVAVEQGESRFGTVTQSTSDLAVTAVAVTPLTGETQLYTFDQILLWLADVLNGEDFYRTVSVSTTVAPAQIRQFNNSVPVRVNLINPVLVNANGGVAPFVLDMKIRATSVQ